MASVSYSSVLLQRPGAAEFQSETPLDAAGVAWHYGNPLGEQRAAQSGPIVVDRSHRRFLQVSGQDSAEFLNNLLSQKLDDVPVGYSATALDLDIQGHILHQADITRAAEGFFLDLPAGQADSLRDFLTKMVFWSQVEITEPDYALLTALGDGEVADPASTVFSRDVDWPGIRRRDLVVPRAELASAVGELEAAGASLAGLMAYTAERIRAREPELAVDLDNKSIPHEVPQWIGRGEHAGAVHLNKGCYRGQETVARVENLGRSPRLLVLLHLDGSAPQLPEPGADITFSGRRVGRMGSLVDDCDFGPIALGLVKRSALDSGQLTIGQAAANLDPDSIPTSEGPKAGRAAINKLRGK